MQIVWSTRRTAQLAFHVLERPGVDQLPKLLLAQQLAQEVAVEGKRLRAPLRRRRVVLVHVVGDVVEEERDRIGRGGRRLDVDEVDLARTQAREEVLQR